MLNEWGSSELSFLCCFELPFCFFVSGLVAAAVKGPDLGAELDFITSPGRPLAEVVASRPPAEVVASRPPAEVVADLLIACLFTTPPEGGNTYQACC
jgi:hypothetical protein